MTARTVVGSLEFPVGSGSPCVGARISATLYTGTDGVVAYGTAGDRSIGSTAVLTDNNGEWSLSLEPNANITPSGTVWKITEEPPDRAATSYYIEVPDSVGPHDATDLLTDPPTAITTNSRAYTDAMSTRLGLTSSPSAYGTRISSAPALTIMGMDASAGRLWARDATNGNLSQSDNWGTSWTHLRGLPSGASQSTMTKVLTFGGDLYMSIKNTSSTKTGIYRAADVAVGTSLTWEASPVFEFDNVNHTLNTRSVFNAGSSYLFAGTYAASGTGSDNTEIWRSADGTTWTVCHADFSGGGGKHVHAVAEDFYNVGHIYASFGDNGSPFFLRRSTDHGATWTTVLDDVDWQAVQLSFSERWVWMASDRIGSSVFVYDRDTQVAYEASQNWHYHTAVPRAAASTDSFYEIGYWGACDPATDAFYLAVMDTSTSGNKQAVFRLLTPGGRLELIESAPAGGVGECFIGNGYAWIGGHTYPLAQFVAMPT